MTSPAGRLGSGPNGVRDIFGHSFFDDFPWDDLLQGAQHARCVPRHLSGMSRRIQLVLLNTLQVHRRNGDALVAGWVLCENKSSAC